MTIPNSPLEHPRDPDRRCNVLVSTRGPKFSARSSREHASGEKCRRAVIIRWLNGWYQSAALSLVWHPSDWVRGGTAVSSRKLVPITTDFLHYLEPSSHAVKRKKRGFGSHNAPA